MLRFIIRLLRSSPPRRVKPVTRKNRQYHQRQKLTGKCYVIDGDTIVIRKRHIRLFGIDAPELNDPYGQKAKFTLLKMRKGKTITATLTGTDKYDRLVAKCTLPDGTDLSAEMVKHALALDRARFSGGAYRDLEDQGARNKLWRVALKQRKGDQNTHR